MPSLLMPPPSALNQLKVDLRFSTFKAYLHASGLDPNILDSHTTSLLAPTNGAFARLGFTNQYLLLPESRNYLRSIIQHHIVEGVLYSADIHSVPVQYPTLAAQQLSISKRSNDVFARNPKTDPGDRDHVARTTESDILVSTGVVHAVDRILFPPTVKITNADLLRAINATIMLQILAAVDEDLLTSKAERTILAPTDDAFHRVNLTRIFADPEILAHVARLHVILAAVKHEDDDQGHVSLKGGIRYPTLLSPQQTIMIEKSKAGRLTVQVSNRRWGENADAHVVAFGESHTGGVVIIDCVLLIQEDILGWEGFNGWSVVFIIFKVVGSVVMMAMCVWQRGIMKNRSGYEALRDASEV
ncbi:FAS1 domain-containing protein [Jimgerdemannia flammicorona]|uniref:FAS1 domain-containing protein n=1 Tax=Jimgerdemannia flammicorona TaxID=994334 RepID=A0A433A0U5_9FUNG|nr:FAS1 domain-containing protein [Jimgerdemannia flammicorona]